MAILSNKKHAVCSENVTDIIHLDTAATRPFKSASRVKRHFLLAFSTF
jgi:hypothetical protein